MLHFFHNDVQTMKSALLGPPASFRTNTVNMHMRNTDTELIKAVF